MYENTRAQLEGKGSAERSEVYKQLTADEQSDVTAFLIWAESTAQIKHGSVSSYKNYVCNGILKDDGRKTEELTRHEKSAMRMFIRWLDNEK